MGDNNGKVSIAHLYVSGFGSLSSLIASEEDHSAAIYKRFDKLASRDLLYYGSELAELQAIQDQYDLEDTKFIEGDDWREVRLNARDWSSFKKAAESPDLKNQRWKARMELAIRIRKVLKEYREALLADFQLRALGSPSKQSMTAMSRAFHPDGYDVLGGDASMLYPNQRDQLLVSDNDYVTLHQPQETDLLTYVLKTYCSRVFQSKLKDARPVDDRSLIHVAPIQLRSYSLVAIQLTTHFVSTVLAAGLLFTPIYSLFQISEDKPKTTMCLIGVFTILFAGTIALVTNAKRGEIFGATAAYAAVLVVFVSGDFAKKAG